MFSHNDANPMHINSISSISASVATCKNIEESPLIFDSHVTALIGYTQSKFVVEILFKYLCKEKNFLCYIEHHGQVCGNSENGDWSISEQYPLMSIVVGFIIHKMTAFDVKIDWIRVDYASSTILNIILRTENLPTNQDESIYHIVNPHPIQWSDVLNAVRASGMTFDIISTTEWIQEPSKDNSNSAFRLISFYQDIFKNYFKMSIWKTEKTVKITPMLEN